MYNYRDHCQLTLMPYYLEVKNQLGLISFNFGVNSLNFRAKFGKKLDMFESTSKLLSLYIYRVSLTVLHRKKCNLSRTVLCMPNFLIYQGKSC